MDKSIKKSVAPESRKTDTSLTVSPTAGEYANAQEVSLSCAIEGAEIYYTMDGTPPSQNKILYEAPIVVGVTTTVKAKAYKDGKIVSDEIVTEFIITTA